MGLLLAVDLAGFRVGVASFDKLRMILLVRDGWGIFLFPFHLVPFLRVLSLGTRVGMGLFGAEMGRYS